jgi:hypothetical protein
MGATNYPNGGASACGRSPLGPRALGSPLVEKATPALCRLCPVGAPPGATGRLKWPKNTLPEQFTQKNLFLRALLWVESQGRPRVFGVERATGASARRVRGAAHQKFGVWGDRMQEGQAKKVGGEGGGGAEWPGGSSRGGVV